MQTTPQKLEQEISKTKLPVLIEFWASWCAPCQMMKPIVKKIEQEYKDKIKVIKINSDLSPQIVSHYTIKGLPTIIMLKNGKEVERIVSAQSKQTISNIIEKYI